MIILLFICTSAFNNAQAQCKGGQIFVDDRRENVSICLIDASSRGLDIFTTSDAVTTYAYAVTDINNSILYVSTSPNLKFENLIEGTYYVYGFSYDGTITAKAGEYVYNSKFSTGCWQISFTRVTVKLANPNSSEIRTGDFKLKKNLCLNEGGAAVVNFRNISAINTDYVYLITDLADNILEVNTKGFSDFTNAAIGDCKVYGLAYTGRLQAMPSMHITDELSSGCYTLSDNAIDINKGRVNGGNVFTNEYMSFYKFTTDDAVANTLNFSNTGSTEANYTYILTNAQNSIIQFLSEPTYNFEGLSAGVYRIWGFSYSGDILLSEGQSIFGAPFSDGCYRLSFNAITITAEHEGLAPPPCVLEAIDISTSESTLICENDNVQSITIDADMTVNAETNLILADNDNVIINISQIPAIDINGLAAGVYSIVQVLYTQMDGLIIGASINSLSGCFELSNSIQLQILNVDNENCIVEEECLLAASILSVDRDTVCVENVMDQAIIFSVENEGTAQQGIIITDENGQIIELSADLIFQIDEPGTRIFYHINYIDTVQIFGGEFIDDLIGCHVLSEPINITGIDNCFNAPCEVESGELSTMSATALCTDNPLDDEVIVISTGGQSEASLFLLIEIGSPTIIESNTTGIFTFEDDAPGNFEIYQLNYQEPFNLSESIFNLEGCFSLSQGLSISNDLENCLPVFEDCINNGGEISYNGITGICGSDGQNDLINIEMITNGGSNKVFILVNEAGLIVNIAPALVILNNPFPEGLYQIYALSYENFPLGLMINTNLADFEDLCLSNSIEILVSNDFCEGAGVRGGEVSDDLDQTEIKFCTNFLDEIFTVELKNTGSDAFEYTYLETDENNIITRIIDGESVMYMADPTVNMNNRIWGVSYTGNLIAFIGEEISSVALSDDTFSVSSNFVEVEISVVIAEDPIIIGSDIPFLEIPANENFDIDLVPNMSAFLDFNTAYILFDTNGTTIIDILYPNEDFLITLPPLLETPNTGELLKLTTIAYTGNILLEIGGEVNSSFLPNATNVTDGCFEVASTNISIKVVGDGSGIVFPLLGELKSDNKGKLSLRPNPAREVVQVYLPKSFIDQKLTIHIMDAAGKLVFKKNFDKAPTKELIDVSHFTHGMYTIQAYTISSARTAKLLKI